MDHCTHEVRAELWFCTNNTKDVYKDMQANPEIEISVSSPEYAWIRLHGKAVFENNMAAKEMCIQNPIVKGQYGEAANPIFEVFYLDNAHGIIVVVSAFCRDGFLRCVLAVYPHEAGHCCAKLGPCRVFA